MCNNTQDYYGFNDNKNEHVETLEEVLERAGLLKEIAMKIKGTQPKKEKVRRKRK